MSLRSATSRLASVARVPFTRLLPQRACPMRTSVTSRWAEGPSAPSSVGKNEKYGIYINSHFDSGNIEVIDMSDPADIRLSIHEDPFCETDKKAHFQWFNFRMTGVRGLDLKLQIMNGGQASYPPAWNGYQAVASYDKDHWFRVKTSYDSGSGILTICHTPKHDSLYFAYFAPYTWEQHCQLVQRMQVRPNVTLHMLGETLDGHDLDLLQLGTPAPHKPNFWILARQHPGESMAEWFTEGLLERLTDSHDPVARQLLAEACLWVVPNMNPDGTWRGHLRTNAAGFNLNRGWAAPSLEECPEVWHVRQKMIDVGCDLLLDVHGDEELPYVFFIGAEGVPNWNPRLALLLESITTAFQRASPDFQTQHGYPLDAPNSANLTVCNKWAGNHFNCLSVTLEMPFKDTANAPDPIQGWSPERCVRLGAAMATALNEMVPVVKANPKPAQ